MTFSLAWMDKVLREGVGKVIPTEDWLVRGHGDFGTPKGIIIHHTAGGLKGNIPSLGTLINGRPDLHGPLCNLGLARDGTFYLVAAGRAWHAGMGVWHDVHDGNSNMIGIECENTGLPNDQPWPDDQMNALRLGVKAILAHIKAPIIMCCGHKEYALPHGRKVDPDFSMELFRESLVDKPKPEPLVA